MKTLIPLQKLAVKRINRDPNFYLTQWWCNKYNLPRNHSLLLSLTWEELYFEYITDFYSNSPDDLKEAEGLLGYKEGSWTGSTSDKHEKDMKAKLKKLPKVDLSEWQEDVEKGNDQFEDTFNEELDGKND